MPYIRLEKLLIDRLRAHLIKPRFCASCQSEQPAAPRRAIYGASVEWVEPWKMGILTITGKICLTCGWMHQHKKIQNDALRQRVYATDGYECVYCGTSERLSLDHIIPQLHGGSDEYENLLTACRPCNSKRQTGRVNLTPQYGRYREAP